jgi:hypothetical protein
LYCIGESFGEVVSATGPVGAAGWDDDEQPLARAAQTTSLKRRRIARNANVSGV